jgi:regulator of G-protein signaling
MHLIAGLQELTNYLRKEYSHENIRFWLATNGLRAGPASQILQRVQEIYEYEFPNCIFHSLLI